LLLSSVRRIRGAGAAEQFRAERAAQFDCHIADPVVKNRVLTNLYDEPVSTRFVTSAKPLPGGATAWDNEVEYASPEYVTAVAKGFES
jgi:hypothetical protein